MPARILERRERLTPQPTGPPPAFMTLQAAFGNAAVAQSATRATEASPIPSSLARPATKAALPAIAPAQAPTPAPAAAAATTVAMPVTAAASPQNVVPTSGPATGVPPLSGASSATSVPAPAKEGTTALPVLAPRAVGGQAPAIKKSNATPDSGPGTNLSGPAQAQAQLAGDDARAATAQISALAASHKQQVKAQFAGVHQHISSFLSQSIAGAQAFINAKQNALVAVAENISNTIHAASSGALQAAEAQMGHIQQAINGIVDGISAAVENRLQGISSQILSLIHSIPIPNIPGAGTVLAAAQRLLQQATGGVRAALSQVLSFLHATADAGATLAVSFAGMLQQMVEGALALAMAVISRIVQTLAQMLSRALNMVASVLGGIMEHIVAPVLQHLESSLEAAITHSEQEACEQVESNRQEFVRAMAPGSNPSDLKEMGAQAAQQNRTIVQAFSERMSAGLGPIFGALATAAASLIQQLTAGVAGVLHAIGSAVDQGLRSLIQMTESVSSYVRSLVQSLSAGFRDLLGTLRSLVQYPVDQVSAYAQSAFARISGSMKRLALSLIGSDSQVTASEMTGEFTLSAGPAALKGPITKPFPPALEIVFRFAVGLIVAGVGALMVLLFGPELAVIIMANPLLAAAILLVLALLLLALFLLLRLLVRLIFKPRPKPTKRVLAVTPASLELGVGGRDVRATATIAPGTPAVPPLTWTVNPGGTAPAGVSIIGSSRIVGVHAGQPPPATITGGIAITVRAAVTTDPTDFQDSAQIMLVQVIALLYNAQPPLAVVPSLIIGTPPPNTAEPNRDSIGGNTAVVNATTAPAARPTDVAFRRSLGASVAGGTVTPGTNTGDIGLRISDTATGARLDETKPSTAGPAALMADLTINAVPTRVSGLTGNGPLGPYGVLNTIAFASSDALHLPLARIIGELITNGGDQFNIPPPNGAFNPVFLLTLAVPANQWNDQLVTPTGILNVADGRPAIDVNRFVGPGVPHLPRAVIYRQRFQYSSWAGAGTVISITIADGRHVRSLIGSPGAFQFKTEHIFGSASAPAHLEPYVGNALIVFSNIAATPTAAGATGLAADGAATASLTVNSTVVPRIVLWNVLTGDTVVVGGNPATLPAAATLRAGVQTGNFSVRVSDTVFPNRLAQGQIRLVGVNLKNMRAAQRNVPPGTASTTVSLEADPGGRTVNWSVDASSAAAGVTVTPATTGPGAPAMTVTVTRPAGFTGSVTVTATDSVVARISKLKIRFR